MARHARPRPHVLPAGLALGALGAALITPTAVPADAAPASVATVLVPPAATVPGAAGSRDAVAAGEAVLDVWGRDVPSVRPI